MRLNLVMIPLKTTGRIFFMKKVLNISCCCICVDTTMVFRFILCCHVTRFKFMRNSNNIVSKRYIWIVCW